MEIPSRLNQKAHLHTLFFPGLKSEQEVLQGVQLFSFVAISSLQTFVMSFNFCEYYIRITVDFLIKASPH